MLQIRIPIPRFLSAGEIFAGKQSMTALRGLDAARALVLVSQSVEKNGALMDKIRKSINALELRVVTAPKGEPSLAKLQPALKEVAAFSPDWIIAVGGGSVLDAAKLLLVFYEQPEAEMERITRPFGLGKLGGKARLAALPTTAGSGSEVSSAALLTDEGSGAKHAVVSHDLLPSVAILDPDLNADVPPEVVASSGLDALAHAVESYVSRFANPFADIHAEKAVQIILKKLPALINDPSDESVRLEMMMASLMAGWVQNQKVPGLGHAVAHQLGAYGVPHGLACGWLLLPSVEANSTVPEVKARYEQLCQNAGLSGVAQLREEVEGVLSVSEIQVYSSRYRDSLKPVLEKDRPKLIDGALKDICARANPVPMTEASVTQLLNTLG